MMCRTKKTVGMHCCTFCLSANASNVFVVQRQTTEISNLPVSQIVPASSDASLANYDSVVGTTSKTGCSKSVKTADKRG